MQVAILLMIVCCEKGALICGLICHNATSAKVGLMEYGESLSGAKKAWLLVQTTCGQHYKQVCHNQLEKYSSVDCKHQHKCSENLWNETLTSSFVFPASADNEAWLKRQEKAKNC